MSLNINTKLTNNLNGYLLDAKNVKGGYLVVTDFSEFANLPAATMQNGMLAYCQSAVTIQEVYYQKGFYQYDGSVWNAVDFGRAYGDFNPEWRTNGTTIQFCDDINADITATTGMVYIGAATFSDFPSGISNAEVIVEIIPSSLDNCPKVIHLILTSGSIFPFRWEYTYWKVGTSNPSKTGWIGYQNTLKAGNFVTLTNNSNDKTTTINMVPKEDWDHNFFHCTINSTTFSDIYGAVQNDGQIPVALYPIIVEDPQTGEEIEVGNRIYMYECRVYDELQDAYYYKFACVDEGIIYYAVIGQDDQWTLSSMNLQSQLDNKVDKIVGKGLSTNDFTDAAKSKTNTFEIAITDILSAEVIAALMEVLTLPFTANSVITLEHSIPFNDYKDKEYIDIVLGLPSGGAAQTLSFKKSFIMDLGNNQYSVGYSCLLTPWSGNDTASVNLSLTGDNSTYGPLTHLAISGIQPSVVDSNADIISHLSTVATSGSYNDLSDTPDLSDYVSTSTTINGEALTSNITLGAADIDYAGNISVYDKLEDLEDHKQETLVFNTAYDATTNKAATMADVTGIYRIQGNASVVDLNNADKSTLTAGFVYNIMGASGDLLNSDTTTVRVSEGDNVVFVRDGASWKWDKLAATIDLSGYQTLISSTNKLSSDLVDDTNKTHLFVSSSEKSTWNGKSTVSVSATGTAVTEINYITIDGVEKKIANGNNFIDVTTLLSTSTLSNANFDILANNNIFGVYREGDADDMYYYLKSYLKISDTTQRSDGDILVFTSTDQANEIIIAYNNVADNYAISEKTLTPVIETYTITSWIADANIAPFTYKATVTATATIGANTLVELINDQPVLFATYGFSIASISGQVITIYSIGEPSSNVTLKIKIGG